MTKAQRDFALAVKLRDQGDTKDSLAILSRLAESPDATAAVFAILGSLQWDASNLPEAVISFQKAVELAPHSEDASLGLFHTLMESQKEADAFAEMKRFLSIADSQEYRTLLKEIQDSSDHA